MESIRTPTDARWSCSGCGSCCRLYKLGPVEPEIIAGLEARGVEAAWPAAASGWATQETGPDGAAAWFLRHTAGHCVFLRDDNLCAIHALFGADAKPGFCREYPFRVLRDPAGLVVIARPECSAGPRRVIDGQAVAEQAAEVLALPRVGALNTWRPARVEPLAGVQLPLARWMSWERALLDTLDVAGDLSPEAAVAALRTRLYGLAGERPKAPTERVAALRVLVDALAELLTAAGQPSAGRSTFERDLIEQAGARLDLAAARLSAGDRLDEPLAPDAARYLLVTLRGHVLGKSVHSLGSAAAGLGAFLLDAAIARTVGADPVSAAALAPRLPLWSRFTANQAVRALLISRKAALVTLFESAAPTEG